MKALATIGLAAMLTVCMAGTALAAQAQVGLGTAAIFAVLAGRTVTNTGSTTISGDVGLDPGSSITGFSKVTLHGTKHIDDGVALQAKNDLVAAYVNAAGRKPVTNVATELGGKTLKAGVYRSPTLGLTGTLTLNAQGNPDAVFVFMAGSTLITAPSSRVVLTNGASACNVFWQVGSSATLNTSTSFKGTIMALTSISLKTGATLQGRALARNGAVTLESNVISNASCVLPPTNTITAVPAAPSESGALPIGILGALAIVAFAGSLGFMVSRSRGRK